MSSTLYRGGRLWCREPAASSLLVVDGLIVWIGTDETSRALDATEIVELDGAWLSPAFTEGHIHLAETGLAVTNSVAGSVDRAALQRQIGRLPRLGRVLLGQGWDDSSWAEPPTHAELPDDLPTYIARTDLHSALINPALASRVLGIEAMAGWQPNGFVTGDAHVAAREAALGLVSQGELLDFALAGLRACAASGIATVHEMAGPAITGFAATSALMERVYGRTDLPEVLLWWGELNGFEPAAELGAFGVGGDLVVDGSLGSRTAWLLEPYSDADDVTGRGYLRAEEIRAHVVAATRLGRRTSFHAIGDAALLEVRRGFESAVEDVGIEAIRSGQHQVEHAILADRTFIDFSSKCNIAWSVQPAFAAEWGGSGGMYESRLGRERLAQSHPLAEAANAGVTLVFGSDSPVTRVDPWRAISSARSAAAPLSPNAAFRAHTLSGPRRTGRNAELAVGNPATFSLWRVNEFVDGAGGARFGSDPRAQSLPIPSTEAQPQCLMTVRDGQVIFDAGLL